MDTGFGSLILATTIDNRTRENHDDRIADDQFIDLAAGFQRQRSRRHVFGQFLTNIGRRSPSGSDYADVSGDIFLHESQSPNPVQKNPRRSAVVLIILKYLMLDCRI